MKPQISFSLNFASVFTGMRDNSSVLFWLQIYMIWTKGANQSENFRLSAAHVKFHQICTLIGSLCWKSIKFQLKKYRGVMSYDTEKWCKTWRKTNLFFKTWEEFGNLRSEHSKASKTCTLIGPFHAKYIIFDLKNLEKFYQSAQKFQNWNFDALLLFKVENVWA